MQITTDQKGKGAELMVFGELIRKGVDLYIPIVDIGIDAIIKKKDGTYLQIQVKSTKAHEQAGYFNVYDINEHREEKFFIICVDMNEDNLIEKGKPNIWVLPATDFKKYMVSGCRLPIYETRRGDKEPRYKLLQDCFYAWESLTG